MPDYIELYNDDILETISTGKLAKEFDENSGDYVKIELYNNDSTTPSYIFYSNRLLLKYEKAPDNYYFGNYYFNGVNFMEGKEYRPEPHSVLVPITIGDSADEPLNKNTLYKKQFDIFKDDNGKIYLKVNDILRLNTLSEGIYKLRIYFLRNLQCTIGMFFGKMKNNLIENGNFFAGLEATQTGDLDRSTGKNNFVRLGNPGFSKFVLEQDGINYNNIICNYDMKITGIKPSRNYIFSCWVAWNAEFDGDDGIVEFSNVSSYGSLSWYDRTSQGWGTGFVSNTDTDLRGTTIKDSKVIDSISINNLLWERRIALISTDESANLSSMRIHIGINNSDLMGSVNIYARRYFTDLRFEEINDFNSSLDDYLALLKGDKSFGFGDTVIDGMN